MRTTKPKAPRSAVRSRGIVRPPTADGKPAPMRISIDRKDRIKREFVEAYHQLNRAYAGLLKARTAKTQSRAARRQAERSAQQQIEKALCSCDEVQDRYASYGVIAEPVMEDGFTVDLKFTFGGLRSRPSPFDQEFSSSAYISIPAPARPRPDRDRA